MSDLEEVRQKKMDELKQHQLEQQKTGEREQAAEMQVTSLVRKLLDDGAMQRLNNVRLVNRELYLRAVQTVLMMYRARRFSGKLNDADTKILLEKLSQKRETTITRK